MGAKKKYKAHILKYVPCILKYLRPIFCPLKTGIKTVRKTWTNTDNAFCLQYSARFTYAKRGQGSALMGRTLMRQYKKLRVCG